MRWTFAVCLFVVLCSAAGLGCVSPERSGTDVAAMSDPSDAPSNWVTIYDPERAWSGYTLALYRGREPVLFDMNGHEIHSWPEARVKSRVRLLDGCSLLGVALGRAVVEYDWEGREIWRRSFEGGFPHHDVIRLDNGNTMTIVLRDGERTDDVVEIDPAGDTVWEWRAGTYLRSYLPDPLPAGELTHLNSVQMLPENPHFDSGDARFRPGNVLVSARNMNAIFVIDKETKDVVWFYDDGLDRQHEALMIPPGFVGYGNIQVFDNGLNNRIRYRRSAVFEIDPTADRVNWTYSSDRFFSPTSGLEQPLPNGNVFVASSRSGRVFEATRAGDVVWQWEPSFEPVRPSRYGYDHCPQLAALGRPDETPVAPPASYDYVDPRIHTFARAGGLAEVTLDGENMKVLKAKKECHRILIPEGGEVWVGYGLNGRGLGRSGSKRYHARFRVSFLPDGDAEPRIFVDDRLRQEIKLRNEQTIDASEFVGRWGELCVNVEHDSPAGPEPAFFGFWKNPVITSARQRQRTAGPTQTTSKSSVELGAAEAEVHRRQLEAHGYIN